MRQSWAKSHDKYEALLFRQQDHFAELFLILQVPMRLGDFGHRVNTIDHGLQRAPENEFENAVQFAERSHEGAEQTLLLGEEGTQVQLHVISSGNSAGD